MSDPTKWVPRLITATAVIHLLYGLVVPNMAKSLRGIARDGLVNTVDGNPERESWLWFMLTGVTWLGLGEVVRWSVRETGRIPARLGAWLLAVAVPLIVASPASGGWLVAAIGAFALRAARSPSPRRDAVTAPLPASTRP